MKTFMDIAFKEARQGMLAGDGGPFGAVVVKDNKVIAGGHNTVIASQDSTAHAEIVAIRKAEQELGTHDLSGCELYTSCYPCPMCLGAIMWARITRVYFGCSTEDAAAMGFDDRVFYEAIADPGSNRLVALEHCDSQDCRALMQEWLKQEDRTTY